ncbi:unnamed protein product, partial [Clonostachys solani]
PFSRAENRKTYSPPSAKCYDDESQGRWGADWPCHRHVREPHRHNTEFSIFSLCGAPGWVESPSIFQGKLPQTYVHSPYSYRFQSKNSFPIQSWQWKKLHVVCTGFYCAFNGNLGTSAPSGAMTVLASYFSISSRSQLALLNSLYMLGYVIGPLIWGPLSEHIGRKPVMAATYLTYVVFSIACAAAPSWPALLVFRVLCGLSAAAPNFVSSGLYADIFDQPSSRGIAMSLFMFFTSLGPFLAPLLSGTFAEMSWRWSFWIAVIISLPGVPLVIMLPETYAPVIYAKRTQGRSLFFFFFPRPALVPENLASSTTFSARDTFLRPFHLFFTIPKLLFSSLYTALAYAIMYLVFQAYPVIFEESLDWHIYHVGALYVELFQATVHELTLRVVIVGACIAFSIFAAYTRWHMLASQSGTRWTTKEAYRRLPLACLASPLMVLGMFWLGWTSGKSLPPILPMLSGLFFGTGYLLLFMSMLNYISDTLPEFAASAQAVAATIRSIGAACLPLAAGPMYAQFGVRWAPSLLAFISLAMGVIPFIFILMDVKVQKRAENKKTGVVDEESTGETLIA